MIGAGGGVLMALFLEFAGDTVVFLVLEEPVRPTVGRVGAGVGTSSCLGWGDGGCGGSNSGWSLCWGLGYGGIGAVIAGAAGGSSAVATVLVGIAKVAAKKGEGFGGVVLVAPFATGDVEHASGVDDVVADADDGGVAGCIVAGGGEADSGVQLGEEGFDGRWWVPRCVYAELVGVELVLSDFAVVGPEVREEVEAGDMAVAEGGVVEVFDIVISDGCDDLGAKGLVYFVVGAKDGACCRVKAVELRDLVGRGAGGEVWNGWRVDGGDEGNGG